MLENVLALHEHGNMQQGAAFNGAYFAYIDNLKVLFLLVQN